MKKALFALMILVLFAPSARADMGAIRASEVHVSEDAQKAVILHNFQEEILILGTDLRADQKTGLIRFIPFPSEPQVAPAPGDPFGAVLDLVKKHKLVFVWRTKGSGNSASGVEVRFHGKMGAHEVTVVKVNDAGTFRQWVGEYFKKIGLPVRAADPEIETVVENYLSRGLAFFVFDYVELTADPKSVEPLAYWFACPELYYPLITSNTFGGKGEIDLFVLSPRTVCQPLDSDFTGCLGLSNLRAGTSAEITPKEAAGVHPEAPGFFKDLKIILQPFRYYGDYRFENDVFFDLHQGFDRVFSADEFIDSKRDDLFAPLVPKQ